MSLMQASIGILNSLSSSSFLYSSFQQNHRVKIHHQLSKKQKQKQHKTNKQTDKNRIKNKTKTELKTNKKPKKKKTELKTYKKQNKQTKQTNKQNSWSRFTTVKIKYGQLETPTRNQFDMYSFF